MRISAYHISRSDRDEGTDRFHWIAEAGELDVADLQAVADAAWDEWAALPDRDVRTLDDVAHQGRYVESPRWGRDAIVFDMCKRMGLAVAWNLAGGYQRDAAGGIEPVLAIHRATMRACVQRFVAQG